MKGNINSKATDSGVKDSPKCRDCGAVLPTSPVVVFVDGELYRFCSRMCAAGFLGFLDPSTGCPL
jgi:hypothetical protein